MTKRSITKKRRNRKRKKTHPTCQAPLCAFGEVMKVKDVFSRLHEQVCIPQKTVVYRPTDKLVFVVLGMLAGAETVSEINTQVRPDSVLLRSFGYSRCADQSVIQQTLDAATETTVWELEGVLEELWSVHNRWEKQCVSADAGEATCVDIDMSALPVSRRAEGSEKGYVAKQRPRYTRQLVRMLFPRTQEIVSQRVYAGNTRSDAVFKPMVSQLESVLDLDTAEKRRGIQLRFDAGFGTDANINYALWRGYEVLGKMYSSRRAKKLAETSVETWESVPAKKAGVGREAGWVSMPHRYGRKTVQVAVRTPKKDGTWSYAVLVSTNAQASLKEIVSAYDERSGVPESTFCQDYQALSLRKYRKSGHIAQEILVRLAQLAHNLLIWVKAWLAEALAETHQGGRKKAVRRAKADAHLAGRGLKRLRRDILSVPGEVRFKGEKVVGIQLNPLYPLVHHVTTTLQPLLKNYNIDVLLDKT